MNQGSMSTHVMSEHASADGKRGKGSIVQDSEATIAINVIEVDQDGVQPVQLAKSFSSLAAFGFCFAVLNSWVVLLAGLGAGLASGGPTTCKSF